MTSIRNDVSIVDASIVRAWLNDETEIALLDVREAGQFGEGHPFFATPLPYSRLEIDAPRLVPRPDTRIVLLDDQVELKCPLEDLPLDGRDPKTLIAFLKAMEFTNLTKRVGEAMGIDPNAIDPDPALRADRAEATTAEPAPAPAVDEAAPAAAATTSARQLSLALPPVASDRKRAASLRPEATTPLGLVRQRLAEISGRKVDRAGYQTIRDVDTLGQWIAQAKDQGVVAVDLVTTSADPMIAALIGVSLALAPNQAAYVPLGHREHLVQVEIHVMKIRPPQDSRT